MNKNTITCFLCGGVHIYPGPRFGNHLLHEHGVVYNHDYIISVSQYKDTYSTLPPVVPSNPGLSLDQFTQTEESVETCSQCAAKPLDVFKSVSPVKNASPSIPSMSIPPRNYHYPSSFCTSTPKAASLYSSLPQVSALMNKNQEHFRPSLQQDLEPFVPVRSGFLFKCALCEYLTRDDTTFYKHITKKHEMQYKDYKDIYGKCNCYW